VLLRAWPDRVKQGLEPFLRLLPKGVSQKIHEILDNFAEGLGMLSGWTELVMITSLSLLLWLTIGLINYAVSFAFDIPMTFLGACLIFVVTAFAIALPQAPSFIGVFTSPVETSLKILGNRNDVGQELRHHPVGRLRLPADCRGALLPLEETACPWAISRRPVPRIRTHSRI